MRIIDYATAQKMMAEGYTPPPNYYGISEEQAAISSLYEIAFPPGGPSWTHQDELQVKEMAQAVDKLPTVVLLKCNKMVEVIDGFHRVDAYKRAGLRKVNVLIFHYK